MSVPRMNHTELNVLVAKQANNTAKSKTLVDPSNEEIDHIDGEVEDIYGNEGPGIFECMAYAKSVRRRPNIYYGIYSLQDFKRHLKMKGWRTRKRVKQPLNL